MRRRRSDFIKLSKEGIVLKQQREKKNLTVRKLAEMIGRSPAYVSHIEGGRADPPNDEALSRYLAVLDFRHKYFRFQVRELAIAETPEDKLVRLVGRLDKTQINLVLSVVEGLVKAEK